MIFSETECETNDEGEFDIGTIMPVDRSTK
jgi:hypothetical protein